jgi:hypothetical protein
VPGLPARPSAAAAASAKPPPKKHLDWQLGLSMAYDAELLEVGDRCRYGL